MSDMPTMGPVQLLVVGFDEPNFTGEILEELRRLREHDVIRLVDLMVVNRETDGSIEVVQLSDLTTEEAEQFGALVGALIGIGTGDEDIALSAAEAGAEAMADGHVFDEDEVWYVSDAIPNGSAAAIALIEHRWAIPLREKIVRAGGMALADEWIHPADLVAIGMAAAAEAEPAG